ncbi:hypothetical protein C5167_041208 [Papaver somniferum]|nr:ankyrin repeat-containing protein NPR4-like isoform X1 [Papaver somniferum]RZC48254.1 hypothetical protein C5167_041208 [Papaver somniferum]
MYHESYRPLLEAAMNNDWQSARVFIDNDPGSVKASITVCGRTALHIAAGSAHSEFVLNLIEIMPIEALELKDRYDGNTALHLAVIAGLEDAVKVMVKKHKKLIRICNNEGLNPLLNAAIYVSRKNEEIIRFLCDEMQDEPTIFQGHSGAHLICSITHAALYELATTLIDRHPSLATAQEDDGNSTALYAIAEKDLSIPTAYAKSILSFLTYYGLCEITKKPSIFLKVLFFFDHNSRGFHARQLQSIVVLELVELIFKQFKKMNGEDKYQFFFGSNFIKTAVKNGSIDIVRMCISTYPDQLWIPQERRNIFEIAVKNRQEKIFDYLYEHMNADEKILTTRTVESNGGNILHVAAKIAPPSRLNIYSSPVAQIQSEIIWFKKVKNRVPRALRNMRNNADEIPREVFTREHKDLVKKAEAYMIRTAESCQVVAALVATVAFAAAITLPGGTFSDVTDATKTGKPVLLQKQSFLVFMVADALALFSSTTAILLFLSIYIGNHTERNFQLALPRTLKRGLRSLILSVLSVVIAFSMALSMILEDRYRWAPYLMFAVAAFTFYRSLNCPLKLIFELDGIEKPLYWTDIKRSPTIRALSDPSPVPWRLAVYWEDCLRFLSSIQFRYSHIYGEGNAVADLLGKCGAITWSQWWNEPPYFIGNRVKCPNILKTWFKWTSKN